MIAWLKARFVGPTGGADPTYLLVLFLLFFFDEFDTAGFNVLAPQIKKTFDLSNQGFGLVVGVNLLVLIILSIPLGYYGDRLPRTKLVVLGAILAGTFSLLTGAAPTLLLLVFVRIGNGMGLLVNDPVHRSLLSDWYEPGVRPQVYAAHANGQRYGAIIGAAFAGGLAYVVGWRFTFAVLFVPIVMMAFVASRTLKEPVRGATDDPLAALVAAEERAVSFSRGVRILMNVRTLRTQFTSWVAIGAGLLPLSIYIPIYLDEEFHLNSFEIGLLVSFGFLAQLIAVQLSGRWTMRWVAKGLGEPVKYAGYALAGVGPCILVMSVSHYLPLSIAGLLGAYFVGGIFTPPFLATQAIVSPARVRTLSFSFGALFIGSGFVLFLLIFGQVANNSVRTGLAATSAFWIIGGLILRSAGRTVPADAAKALATLAATAAMRAARLSSSANRSVLQVRGVDVSYGPVQVLFGVDLEMNEGEIIALLGTNGAGKSTLLKAISGLVPIQAGSIFLGGEDISGFDPEDSFATGLVQVPGGRGIFPGLTVRENLEVSIWAAKQAKLATVGTMSAALEQFPRLAERIDQPASVLSGGEAQMLTLAQAFISKPKLLMIDELSLGLAPIIVEGLLEAVRTIHAGGTSIILVEQSVNVALTVADRAVFMEKGEVRFSGPTAELLHRDDILRAVFLGGAASAEGMFG